MLNDLVIEKLLQLPEYAFVHRVDLFIAGAVLFYLPGKLLYAHIAFRVSFKRIPVFLFSSFEDAAIALKSDCSSCIHFF